MYQIIKSGRLFPSKPILLLMVALVITLQFHTLNWHIISKPDLLSEVVVNYEPEFCQITQHVQLLREKRNTSQVNPSQNLVDEFYDYVTFSPNVVCPKKKESRYLVMNLINSARDNFMERQLIRQTWGSITKYRDWQVISVFLLGQSDYCAKQFMFESDKLNHIEIQEQLLMEEHEKYGDLVIGAFADNYKNLTYKHLMGYKFVLEKCSTADWIIKTDDDVFSDIPALLEQRTGEQLIAERANSSEINFKKPPDIYCLLWRDKPARGGSKWLALMQDWPEDKYPDFCLGGSYAIAMEWLKKLYFVRKQGKFYWIDDLFILGRLRKIAEKEYGTKVKPFFIGNRVTATNNMPGYVLAKCKKKYAKFGFFVLLVRSRDEFQMEMKYLWKRCLENANVNMMVLSKN